MKNVAIVVSGGPAPGINSAISSCVIAAENRGYKCFGLEGGFRGFAENPALALKQLRTEELSRIYRQGGSLLGTSRFNPLQTKERRDSFLQSITQAGINALIVIGGDGSATVAYQLCQVAPELQIIHLPKTIDNDLFLPHNYPSFGFESARQVGTEIVETLMTDAKTVGRWFIASTMGRNAGFLALAIGLASRVTLTLIPEEFNNRTYQLAEVAELIVLSMKQRLAEGKKYGVALIAEGIIDRLDANSSSLLKNCPRDEIGRIKYSECEIVDLLKPELQAQIKAQKLDLNFNTKNIGYELRCHAPNAFDVEYTTFLGHGAIQALAQGQSAVTVVKDFDKLGVIPLQQMIDDQGKCRSRIVDLKSDDYQVARHFMIR
ncbi:6-phosphofructokinase [bacterium]|nr:6-phosphofructokinase [bacterium]